VIAVLAIVAGILVAAALDNHLGWGTLMSAALAIYCHRLYRQPASAATAEAPVPPTPASEDDELRPGWAARWGREPSAAPPPRISRQESSPSGHVQVMGGASVGAGPRPGTSLGRYRNEREMERRRPASDVSGDRV
jgi:hypothetical protein